MDIVTYLLGAGASAQCLPIVKDLSKQIKEMISTLRNLQAYGDFSSYVTYKIEGNKMLTENDLVNEICIDLEWMAEACDIHSSIDTFAKKLYILQSSDYTRLKIILSVYFTIAQKWKRPDLRYDNFWASIIDLKDVFPTKLRMVSWNYDFQLEQSYLNFSDNNTLAEAYDKLSIRSFCDSTRSKSQNEFSIFKLNGSATVSENFGRPIFFSETLSEEVFYKNVINRYFTCRKQQMAQSNLSFAWEHDLSNEYYKELKESLYSTTTLAVIGYSFPYFNRQIDKYIINECMPYLQKVYFQAPDASNLRERFSTILKSGHRLSNGNNLFLITDLDQFTFPNEL